MAAFCLVVDGCSLKVASLRGGQKSPWAVEARDLRYHPCHVGGSTLRMMDMTSEVTDFGACTPQCCVLFLAQLSPRRYSYKK